MLNSQLTLNILNRVVLHFLHLSKFEGDWWLHLLHHIVKWLLHWHKLVSTHHARRELLGLSILAALSGSIGGKHHLHVDIVWINVHAISWEAAHLSWHHHTSWEVSDVTHIHVTHRIWIHSLWLGHIIHLMGDTTATITTTNTSRSVLVLSELGLSVCVRALVFISAIAV